MKKHPWAGRDCRDLSNPLRMFVGYSGAPQLEHRITKQLLEITGGSIESGAGDHERLLRVARFDHCKLRYVVELDDGFVVLRWCWGRGWLSGAV